MRSRTFAALALAASCLTCQSLDNGDGHGCSSGRVCGYTDHEYTSVYYCPPNPPFPSGWFGFTWQDADRCHMQCAAASNWGCDASGCDAGCDRDTGSGQWTPCESSGGTVTDDGCYLPGSGMSGETVPCECR